MIRPNIAEVLTATKGAWMMFRRNPSGAALFGTTPADFWKSFWAAIVILPGYFLLVMLSPNEARSISNPARTIPIDIISYTIGWCLWPLIVAWLADMFKFRDRYIRYITVYNWASIPQVGLMLVLVGGCTLLNFDQTSLAIVLLGGTIWLIAYHAFIVRVTLGLSFGLTLLLVIGEMVVGQVLLSIRDVLFLSPA